MIFKPRRKGADVVLICDRCRTREVFAPGTTFETVVTWVRREKWKIIHRGGWLYDHECPVCQRLRLAPQAYWDRLSA